MEKNNQRKESFNSGKMVEDTARILDLHCGTLEIYKNYENNSHSVLSVCIAESLIFVWICEK